ncbi:MAG: phosphoribosyl-AMP cyclohydrolase [Promethearchaeota archaeon]|nr:MAG: phosphoribosyl-AMP cyclohydrolase [Candidatus Lokiarchaeota archaeon]
MLEQLDFSKLGNLVVILIQDWQTNELLMCGFANREAIVQSLTTGYSHFYSRSRKTLWKKGGTSGHTQEIKEVFIDCDGDAILFKVDQKVAACHTGYKSCFFRKLTDKGDLEIKGQKMFEPSDVY